MGFSAKLGYELPSLLCIGLSDLVGDLVGFEGRRFLELTPEPLTSRFECWYRRLKSLWRIPEADYPHLSAVPVNEEVVVQQPL